jgi:hypothetical protein
MAAKQPETLVLQHAPSRRGRFVPMIRYRLQFSMRRLMAVVLVVALVLVIGTMLWRSLEYEWIGRMHQEAIPLDYLANWAMLTDGTKMSWEEYCSRREYHAKMASKYRCAATHPWLAVEPDPDIETFRKTLVVPPLPD